MVDNLVADDNIHVRIVYTKYSTYPIINTCNYKSVPCW